MKYHSNNYSSTVITSVNLPKYVQWLFRFYAAYTVLIGIIIYYVLIYSLIRKNQKVISNFSGDTLPLESTVIITLLIYGIFITLFTIFFIIGILQYKRWVLPLIILLSVHITLIGSLQIINGQTNNLLDTNFFIISVVLAIILIFIAVRYWSSFAGSAQRLLIQIPFILILLPIMIFSILFALFPDNQKIDDLDLLRSVEVLLPEDNVFYSLPDLGELSEDTRGAVVTTTLHIVQNIDGIDFSDPAIIFMIEETRGLTDAFLTSTERKGYQCPSTTNNQGLDSKFCSLNDIRNLAILTSIRALEEAEKGNVDRAIMTATGVIKMGSHLRHTEQSLLTGYLVGLSIQQIGMDTLEQVLKTAETSTNETILSAISTLKQAEISQASLDNIFRHEYTGLKQESEKFAEYSNYFYQHNKTVNMFADLFRKQIFAISKGCNIDTSQEEAVINELLTLASSASNIETLIYLHPNYIGKMLFSMSAASITSLDETRCELNEQNKELQALLVNQT